MELIIAKTFKLTKKLGQGAFGQIYQAINLKNYNQVAVKLQPVKTNHPQLFYQAKLLAYLNSDESINNKGIPQVYYSGTEGQYNLMVIDLLGPSLEQLFQFCEKIFDLKTSLIVGLQLLDRIEFVHSKKFIHRDIKPDNFLIGTHSKSHVVYLIDFGLAKKYIGKDGKHIPYRDNKLLTGTARYASLNTHIGIQQGRRDDIQSLGYVLIYFLKGSLPWQNLKANNKKQKYERIMQKKLSITIQMLTKGLPQQITQFLTQSRKIYFDEPPDYNYYRKLLKSVMEREGIVDDHKYCWSKKVEQKQRQNNKLKEDFFDF